MLHLVEGRDDVFKSGIIKVKNSDIKLVNWLLLIFNNTLLNPQRFGKVKERIHGKILSEIL